MRPWCSDEAVVFLCANGRALEDMLAAARPVLGEPMDLCVWTKAKGETGNLYRSSHEMVVVFGAGAAAVARKGGTAKKASNVWDHPLERATHKSKAAPPSSQSVAMVSTRSRPARAKANWFWTCSAASEPP